MTSNDMVLRNPRRMSRLAGGVLIGLLFAVPLLYILMISLETAGQYTAHPLAPPASPSVKNFSDAWTQADLGRQLINTIIYATVSAALSVGLSLLIAFPIARKLIRGASWLHRVFVIGICVPLPVIPLFIEANDLHLYDNRIGYILLHIEPGLPLGVILLTAFLTTVPKELDEAAFMDGCSYLRYLFSIVVPLAWPSIIIAFLYSFLAVWNNIIGPIVFLANPDLFPVTRGVYNFYGTNTTAYTLLAAAIVIVSIPVLVLFLLSQRQLLRASISGVSR